MVLLVSRAVFGLWDLLGRHCSWSLGSCFSRCALFYEVAFPSSACFVDEVREVRDAPVGRTEHLQGHTG